MVRKIGIVLLILLVMLSTIYQLFDLYRFVNSGARFTLEDGHSLCARVLRLEARYDLTPGDCVFSQERSQ